MLVFAIIAAAGFLVFSDSTRETRRWAVTIFGPSLDTRQKILSENPGIAVAIARGGGFGGDFSIPIAGDIFGASKAAVEDAFKRIYHREIRPGLWLIRMPLVNAVLLETLDGLVLIDTGMKAAGEALRSTVRELSDRPLNTVIYTHGHVDHAFGLGPLLEDGESPEIIAHENLPERFRRYLRLRKLLARYMSQPTASLPSTTEDFIWPTRTFFDSLTLDIGNEILRLQHFRGETDDHLYVWLEQDRVLIAGDFYQGFLPNLGNGKRIQRFADDWIMALDSMRRLDAEVLLSGHGEPIIGREEVEEHLGVLHEALQSIVAQTINGLNKGMRKDQVARSVQLPLNLKNHPSLAETYVSAADLSRMVARQHTGWWNDIPSDWSPAPLEQQAEEITALIGKQELLSRVHELAEYGDLRMASHLVDWAFYANPGDPETLDAVMEIYIRRIQSSDSLTQAQLVYLDQVITARELRDSLSAKQDP